ncbi:acyl-CoA N-acyltransferase [Phlebopus sp. FC_14]|nr:acyl-CoA N-acyltransferase [Phlebopus sp. FC_14]
MNTPTFTNNYTPPPPPPPPEYPPTDLESPLVKLIPFIPAIHAATFFENIPDPQHFYRYYPFEGQEDPDECLLFWDRFVRKDPNSVMFAIMDKSTGEGDGVLAGTIGLLGYSPNNLSVEIGVLCVLPAFQRTHVASHAVGILLKYCFALPRVTPSGERDGPGLGMRRVHWYAHPDNEPSLRLAARMGLKREATLRWTWVLPAHKKLGLTPREGDLRSGPGRHTAVMAITWEDWEEGGKAQVDSVMSRWK